MGRTFKQLETKWFARESRRRESRARSAMPIFQSAMFEYAGETSYHDLKYIRLNNTPTHAGVARQARGD